MFWGDLEGASTLRPLRTYATFKITALLGFKLWKSIQFLAMRMLTCRFLNISSLYSDDKTVLSDDRLKSDNDHAKVMNDYIQVEI